MEDTRPAYVCEWGNSEFADIILSYDFVRVYVSIEHQDSKIKISDKRFFKYIVPDLELYVSYPRVVSKDFDIEFKMMLINGEEKLRCLKETKVVLHYYGVAFLPNAQKMEYMKPINDLFPKQEWDRPKDKPYTVALKTYQYEKMT